MSRRRPASSTSCNGAPLARRRTHSTERTSSSPAGAAGRPTLAWASAAPLTTIPGTQATRFKSIQMGFLYVTIDGKKLTAEFVGPTGTDFTRVLNKP